MSRLRVFRDSNPSGPLSVHQEPADIAAILNKVGVRFEQWHAPSPLRPGAPPDQVLDAYRADIERLMRAEGYKTADVISLKPDHPDRVALRNKFLSEHTHSEDEVRFFVAGSGLFSLHIGAEVYEVTCEKGDLIGVPNGTRHWFDMGAAPSFIAIRLFTDPAGWVATSTDSDIADRFPRFEPERN